MTNTTIAHILNEMADLFELSNDNPFRIRAFRRAAQTIDSISNDVLKMDRNELLEIPGIGKGIADYLGEFKATGKIHDHQRLRASFPEGLFELMKFPGLGAKKALVLANDLKIDSLEKLKRAAEAGKIRRLAGFGEKTEKNILANMDFAASMGQRWLITDARAIAFKIIEHLKSLKDIEKVELAGSARRWKETIGDLDFVCTSSASDKAIAHFLAYDPSSRVLAKGSTKASVVLPTGLQCDFRVVESESFGAALLYFTGSKEHNVRLRERAQSLGYTLNEYGLKKNNAAEGSVPLAGRTEEEIYKRLGLPWIPPELREDRGEIEAAHRNNLPKLITEDDVRGDYHNHTTLSDGKNTLEEMITAARNMRWNWFFSADHSPSLKVANGLSVDRLRSKIAVIRKQSSNHFRVYCSSEVDILVDGKLDYPDAVLSELDCVIASVHSRFNQPSEIMTERILTAISHPEVDILGHISGRLLNKRKSYEIDTEAILQRAAQTQTAIEINGQPERAELTDVHVKRAIELGVPLALNTDAHSTEELQNMELAVHIARRGWAKASDILNTKTATEMIKWLGS